MTTFTINVNMDNKCVECGKGGATDSGLCLNCTCKALDPKRVMKSAIGKAVQQRHRAYLSALETGGPISRTIVEAATETTRKLDKP
jgi:hypothetical protein